MAKPRIAVLIDAENVGCDITPIVLEQLRRLGVVQTACAVGDFSLLTTWVPYARDNGIELVMQPSLGKGKNSADIRLTIEAMDLVHRGSVETVALVTHDRDFTPLALRLRDSGVTVMGFAEREPNVAFRSACSSFERVGQRSKPVAVAPQPGLVLSPAEIDTLKAIVATTCAGGAVHHHLLTKAINSATPELGTKLSGKGKFFKILVDHKIVERVGAGDQQRVQQRAS
ncbi:NYN domain-containing protein [Devosia lacusdianchii]|uniref:NYN domain-containing protein n=1 Tax=Devosia lacusdianchii TaxID=2917991 RepID=UPI001F058B8E|nr:NYN domain-containing protein [Devosia sp. JXJ CY 41]